MEGTKMPNSWGDIECVQAFIDCLKEGLEQLGLGPQATPPSCELKTFVTKILPMLNDLLIEEDQRSDLGPWREAALLTIEQWQVKFAIRTCRKIRYELLPTKGELEFLEEFLWSLKDDLEVAMDRSVVSFIEQEELTGQEAEEVIADFLVAMEGLNDPNSSVWDELNAGS